MKTLLIRVLRSLLTFLGGSVPASAPAPSVPITPPSIPASGFPSQRPRMYHVRIITSESRFEGLMEALEHAGITGMTVTRVLGYGLQKDIAVCIPILPSNRNFCQNPVRSRHLEDSAGNNCRHCKKTLYTGKYGDGKIFISSMENVVKIRTGEEGFDALQDKPL